MNDAVEQATGHGPRRAAPSEPDQHSSGVPSSARPGRDNLLRAPDISDTIAAAARARESRSHFLAEVLAGGVPAVQTPWVACENNDRKLLRLRLRQLLATAPHWDSGRTNAVLGHMAAVVGTNGAEVNAAPLAWLVDPRAAGRRMLAWLDAFRPRTQPWPGFPFAPLPETFAADGPGNPPALVARDRAGVPRGQR